MGNRYQQYVKHRGRRVCVGHECKIHSLILFYDAVHDAILSPTPSGYFLKVLQSQAALTVYTWNHSPCPSPQKRSESLLKILPVKKYCPDEKCVDCIFLISLYHKRNCC